MTAITPITTAERSAAARTPARPAGVGTLEITPVGGLEDRVAWARFVDAAPGGTLYHHPDWCDTVAEVFGHTPRHRLAWRHGHVVGVLPLLEMRSRLAGRLLVSVPYGNAGGILATDGAVVAALADEARALADDCRARVLELRSVTAAVPDFEPVDGYVGFLRELPLHPNDMEAFLPRKARAALRHARERDRVVVFHDDTQVDLVWRLYTRSMRRLGSLNYPRPFFRRLFDRLGTRAWATVCWRDQRPVCGTLSFVFGNTVMPYIVGADERIRSEGAANLMYWAVAERAVRSGLRCFDFGRSRADNRGATAFKKNQGFEPAPLGYQRYVPPGCRPPNLRPSNPRFAVARRLWTRLPLAVTRSLGVWLSHTIPG